MIHHLGPERRAGTGTYRQGERRQEALARTRFKTTEQNDIAVRESWSTDQIIGQLYSTSFASKAVLGNRVGDFEFDLRQNLKRIAPENRFEKINEITVIIAKR